MNDETNLIALVLGAAVAIVGMALLIKAIVIIRKNEIITGKIVDRTSDRNEHYVPVIEYKEKGVVKHHTSSHYSIFQRIGGTIHIVNDKNRDHPIGTLGGMLFRPIILLLTGLFIAAVVLLYETTR